MGIMILPILWSLQLGGGYFEKNCMWMFLPAHEDHGRIGFAFGSACMVDKNTEHPQIELHGSQCNYTGRYRRSGMFGIYLWHEPTLLILSLQFIRLLCNCRTLDLF